MKKSDFLDIIYMIDCTGSMGDYIESVKNKCIEIGNFLAEEYKDVDIKYGAVFYRDPVDSPRDKNEYQDLGTAEELNKRMKTITAYGGGDYPEDWVGAFDILLNKITWRTNGFKLVYHMADDGAHGKEFTRSDSKHNSYEESGKLKDLIESCAKNKITIMGYKIGNSPENSFNKCKEIYDKFKQPDCYYDICTLMQKFNKSNRSTYKEVSHVVERSVKKDSIRFIRSSLKK